MAVVIVKGEGAVLGVNVGHPIVTNGDCGVVILCREGGDAVFPKLLWDFLLYVYAGSLLGCVPLLGAVNAVVGVDS